MSAMLIPIMLDVTRDNCNGQILYREQLVFVIFHKEYSILVSSEYQNIYLKKKTTTKTKANKQTKNRKNKTEQKNRMTKMKTKFLELHQMALYLSHHFSSHRGEDNPR